MEVFVYWDVDEVDVYISLGRLQSELSGISNAGQSTHHGRSLVQAGRVGDSEWTTVSQRQYGFNLKVRIELDLPMSIYFE